MTTVAEIVVKGCSCVFLKLLTTGKRDSYVTMAHTHTHTRLTALCPGLPG